MNYRVIKPFSCPKPGVNPVKGIQLQQTDELSAPVGAVVDLGHLSAEAIQFLTAEGCITPAPAPDPVDKTSKREK